MRAGQHASKDWDASSVVRVLIAIVALSGPFSHAQEPPTRPLNDTGVDWWADATSNLLSSEPSDYPGQDASHGRDVSYDQDADGHAGFALTKLDAQGQPLGPEAVNCAFTITLRISG